MALIPKYHTAVAMFPVDPADVALLNSGTSDTLNGIYAGQMVGLTSAGYVKKTTATSGTPIIPIGIAGDSLATSAGHTAYADSLVVNAAGTRKSTQNRVSDYFNETLGSGLLSVYIAGGEFYTDMFINTATYTVGAIAYANGVTTSTYNLAGSGMLTSVSTTAYPVGVFTSGKQGFPSGVPGADGVPVDYSMPLASFNGTGFVSFIMNIQVVP